MHAKAFRKLGLVIVILMAIGGGLWFGLKIHRQSERTNLLTKISADADVAVIYWDALSQLKSSEKKWRFSNHDSSDFAGILSSPLNMGIDISINPVLFRNPNDSSFQLVLSLLDQSKFEAWLTEKAGKAWKGEIQNQPKFKICTFENQPFAFVYDPDFAILVFKSEMANSAANNFFNKNQAVANALDALPERRSASEVMAVRLMNQSPLFKSVPTSLLMGKTIFMSIRDNQVSIETEGAGKRKMSNQLIWNTKLIGTSRYPTRLIKELWKISADQQWMLDGTWQLTWLGFTQKELVYTSYVFDDNFNRVPKQVVVLESHPELILQFIPAHSVQLDSLKSHLIKTRFLKQNTVHLGPYQHKFSEINGRWIIGNQEKTEDFSELSVGVNVTVPQMLGDLSELKIPTMNVDSLALNNLKMIDIQLNEQHFHAVLSTTQDCQYHILAIINRLFKL